jgi:PHP family Zn ribbon phosphoesterase
MYHVDGHRACGVSMLPHETRRAKGVCPKCGKQLVVGVLNRVDELADREEKNIPKNKFIPHKYIVPLREIIGEAFDVGVKSKKVEREYANMIKNIGNEFEILVDKDLDDLARAGFDKHIILGIKNMRVGNVKISPGFDGQYGKVKTINSEKIKAGQGRLL